MDWRQPDYDRFPVVSVYALHVLCGYFVYEGSVSLRYDQSFCEVLYPISQVASDGPAVWERTLGELDCVVCEFDFSFFHWISFRPWWDVICFLVEVKAGRWIEGFHECFNFHGFFLLSWDGDCLPNVAFSISR